MTNVSEWSIQYGEMTFRGKRWGRRDGLPVFALHGWLDNCASFDLIAPHLNNVDLIALDLAGHGKTDHRRHAGAYNIWLDIQEIIAIANQLGWEKFALIGHSRGAMISTMIAGTFPERVSHLALIEAFVPQHDWVIAASYSCRSCVSRTGKTIFGSSETSS